MVWYTRTMIQLKSHSSPRQQIYVQNLINYSFTSSHVPKVYIYIILVYTLHTTVYSRAVSCPAAKSKVMCLVVAINSTGFVSFITMNISLDSSTIKHTSTSRLHQLHAIRPFFNLFPIQNQM